MCASLLRVRFLKESRDWAAADGHYQEVGPMTELTQFVRDALAQGSKREDVQEALRSAGWPDDEIQDALSRFAVLEFPVPVPRRRHSVSAKEALGYLVTFFALWVSAISLGNLLSAFVETAFPDPAYDSRYYNYDYAMESVRWFIASLVVAFPLYLILTIRNLRAISRDPALRESPVRKWLISLTLFAAACVALTTLIVVVANGLGGEMGIRFVLKCLVVLAISGGVFGFYISELRRGEAK